MGRNEHAHGNQKFMVVYQPALCPELATISRAIDLSWKQGPASYQEFPLLVGVVNTQLYFTPSLA